MQAAVVARALATPARMTNDEGATAEACQRTDMIHRAIALMPFEPLLGIDARVLLHD